MDISWEDVRVFLAVAEHGSMSAGAKSLRLGQPTVSRRLADLEHQLGFVLFERSVAGVRLTSRGEALVEPARNMSLWASALHREVDRTTPQLAGAVRISAPPGVAFDLLAPFALELRERHREVQLEVISAVRYVDLARREADIALRVGKPRGRDLQVLHSVQFEVSAFASSSYVASIGSSPKVEDIDWISWAPPFEDVPPGPQLRALVPDFAPAFASDDFIVQLRACLSGVGAMVLGTTRHRFSLLESLQPLDVDLGPTRVSTLHVVAPKSALLVPRVRAVADVLIEVLER